jgi:hypothetical protein
MWWLGDRHVHLATSFEFWGLKPTVGMCSLCTTSYDFANKGWSYPKSQNHSLPD